ncbi:MAG TPA: TAXI family TRAP transporter solute-binding subunit, partial [Synergistales bacterium]|nr:TAXI family TRAP transporter solute-binding subunit [Synergistales bacterium]
DKRIDAAIMVGSLGMAGVVEVTTLGLVNFIDIPTDVMDKVIEETPYWVPFDIPANYYKGQTEPVRTYASWNIIAVHEDMDPDLVYNMTRLLFEKKEDLLAVRARMDTMTPDNIKYILVPLHEGAQKYYREMGVCN